MPLSRSIPAAIAMAALGAALVWWSWVALDRALSKRATAPPRVAPNWFDYVLVCLIGLAILAGIVTTFLTLQEVAFRYQHEIEDILSWWETAALAALIEGFVILVGFTLARFARSLIGGYVRPRIAAIVVLANAALLQLVSRNGPAAFIALVELAVAVVLILEVRQPRLS